MNTSENPTPRAPLDPLMNNGGRWHHIMSEAEISRVMRDKRADVIEVSSISMTFLCSERFLSILRCGAGGGDVFNIEGGWVYDNQIAYALDKYELVSLQRNTRGIDIR